MSQTGLKTKHSKISFSLHEDGKKFDRKRADDACHHFPFSFVVAIVDSDDVFILQYTWCLASSENKRDFRALLGTEVVTPVSPLQPYAAAIAIWMRLSTDKQQQLLSWMDERLEELGLGMQLPIAAPVSSVA